MMDHLSFEEYLINKKIDPQKFEQGEPQTFQSFKSLYEVVHPKSFTSQKLFLINKIRRKFHLEEASLAAPVPKKKKMKPVIKR